MWVLGAFFLMLLLFAGTPYEYRTYRADGAWMVRGTSVGSLFSPPANGDPYVAMGRDGQYHTYYRTGRSAAVASLRGGQFLSGAVRAARHHRRRALGARLAPEGGIVTAPDLCINVHENPWTDTWVCCVAWDTPGRMEWWPVFDSPSKDAACGVARWLRKWVEGEGPPTASRPRGWCFMGTHPGKGRHRETEVPASRRNRVWHKPEWAGAQGVADVVGELKRLTRERDSSKRRAENVEQIVKGFSGRNG